MFTMSPIWPLWKLMRRQKPHAFDARWKERFPLPGSLHDPRFHAWLRGLDKSSQQQVVDDLVDREMKLLRRRRHKSTIEDDLGLLAMAQIMMEEEALLSDLSKEEYDSQETTSLVPVPKAFAKAFADSATQSNSLHKPLLAFAVVGTLLSIMIMVPFWPREPIMRVIGSLGFAAASSGSQLNSDGSQEPPVNEVSSTTITCLDGTIQFTADDCPPGLGPSDYLVTASQPTIKLYVEPILDDKYAAAELYSKYREHLRGRSYTATDGSQWYVGRVVSSDRLYERYKNKEPGWRLWETTFFIPQEKVVKVDNFTSLWAKVAPRGDGVYMRMEPGLSSPPIMFLMENQRLQVVSSELAFKDQLFWLHLRVPWNNGEVIQGSATVALLRPEQASPSNHTPLETHGSN